MFKFCNKRQHTAHLQLPIKTSADAALLYRRKPNSKIETFRCFFIQYSDSFSHFRNRTIEENKAQIPLVGIPSATFPLFLLKSQSPANRLLPSFPIVFALLPFFHSNFLTLKIFTIQGVRNINENRSKYEDIQFF